MGFSHRKLLTSTITVIITKPPCPPQLCVAFCSCQNPPPSLGAAVELPPPPPDHRFVPTAMTVTACVLGGFFILGIVCIVARLKYLRRIESRRRNFPVLVLTRDDFAGEDRGPAADHPVWLINFVGLSQSAIDSIAVCEYKRGEGLIEGTECSVCLGEFEDGEELRLLPKCSHAFHIPCIDTWLRSHKNCPLCRAPVVGAAEPARSGSVGETQMDGSGNDLDQQPVGEDGPTSIVDQIGKICDSRAHSDLGENWKMGFEGRVGTTRRPASMDSPSSAATILYHDSIEPKRSSFKNSCKNVGTSSSSRMMKSASMGRVMHKGCASANTRMCTSWETIKEQESSSSDKL